MTRNGYTLMISFKLYENFLAWKPCKDTFQVDVFFAVFELNGYSSCTNKIEMPVSEDYEILSKKFDSFNVNHKSPHETKLGSNVGDERKNAIFSTQFQTNAEVNARQKTKQKLVWSKSVGGKRQKLELGQGYSGAPLPNKVTTTSTKSH